MRYSQQRAGRVRRVHSAATRHASKFHLSALPRAARNVALSASGRRAQQFIMRMDWLYGHNVTAALPV
jgi:hypothetical protein